MPEKMNDVELQNKCKMLLQQLKSKQMQLNGLVLPSTAPQSENLYDAKHNTLKPIYAREKLKKLVKTTDRGGNHVTGGRDDEKTNFKVYDSRPKPKSVVIEAAVEEDFAPEDTTELESARDVPSYHRDKFYSYSDDYPTDSLDSYRTDDIGLYKTDMLRSYERVNLDSYKTDVLGSYKTDNLDTNETCSYTRDNLGSYTVDNLGYDHLNSYTTDNLHSYTVSDNQSRHRPLYQSATPRTQSRRQLIDRNVKIGKSSRYVFDEDDRFDKLNFSYSQVDRDPLPWDQSHDQHGQKLDDDETDLKSVHNKAVMRDETLLKQRVKDEKNKMKPADVCDETYSKYLKDEGNNKRLKSLTKEAMKSLNLSSRSSINLSNNARPSFSRQQQRMMGYDWIAALLDNDTDLMDETENFFQEIKDFRLVNKQQCSNQFYMDGPLALAIDLKPSPVVQEITESKVKPYVVNDRLFTTPLKKCLLDDLGAANDEEEKRSEKLKEPSYEEPRFVRVSIPRSTLQTPNRIKPHRRGSFDASDSCALSQHCLLGWENSRPAMMPSASTVGLSDATGELKSRLTTTLAEAERMASLYSWPFPELTTHKPDLFPSWRREYCNTTLNMTAPTLTKNTSNSYTLPDQETIRKNTNDLLNSTYSMMYEMERLKKERELNEPAVSIK